MITQPLFLNAFSTPGQLGDRFSSYIRLEEWASEHHKAVKDGQCWPKIETVAAALTTALHMLEEESLS